MEFTLPDSPGWSAMHLVSEDWGNIAVITKREYAVSGGVAQPRKDLEGLIPTDTVEPQEVDGDDYPIIRREAETALFKHRADLIYLGRGTQALDSHGREIDTAEFKLNEQVRRRFTRSLAPAEFDTVNLFGYQPRQARLDPPYDPETFDYATDGIDLFWSARQSSAFDVIGEAPDFEGAVAVSVETASADPPDEVDVDILDAFSMTIPTVTATPFVWEGGSNQPANWCRRPPITLEADTITIDGGRVSVLWRGALPLQQYPPADLRRVDLKEAV